MEINAIVGAPRESDPIGPGPGEQRFQVVGAMAPGFSSKSPCKDFLNPLNRRSVRKSIHEAIDGITFSLPEHSSASSLEKLKNIDEAISVWEES
ncbi:hypothetical protein V6N12_012593 [Hibiscus sabdariffa]|uniref:Uncharacterized protein n=1 Tax=Hibiscus sabdariffa TaxID=183260 RepID=A0ABR2DCZ9_9ROSI